MSGTIRLGSLIEKAHIKYRDFAGGQELEAFGVSNTEGITRTTHRKSDDLGEYLVIEPGAFAYNPYRVNVGSIGLTPDGLVGVVSPAYIVFRAKERKLVPDILQNFLKSSDGLRQINKLARGAVRKALRFDDLCEIEFPAISYERQLEILEHTQRVNQQHGQLLSEIEYQQSLLAKLKQAILQEAIQGKLTADWRTAHPDVESASQLLQRIQAEKVRLIATKKLRPGKPLQKITPAEIPFEIPKGWEWHRLGELGQWSGGGTPTKGDDRFWGNEVAWITPKDMKKPFLSDSMLKLTRVGIEESAAKLIPANSILFVVRGMILAHTFPVSVNLVETTVNQDMKALMPFVSNCEVFLRLLLEASSQRILRVVTKSTHGTRKLETDVYETFVIPLPPLAEQKAIVEKVEALMTICRALEAEIEHARTHADHLLQAVLGEAFSGKLAAQDANDKPAPPTAKVIPFPVKIPDISPTDLHAGIIAMAYQRHEQAPKYRKHFHHVKAEKIVHLVEAHLGIDLERMPVKAAAGPNDYPHLKKVESRAKKANWFHVRQEKNGGAHTYFKKSGFDTLLDKTAAALGERAAEVDALINLLLPMDTRQAEIVVTLYAAWNNLLLLGRSPGDEDIVYEARENWHASKLEIEREKFFNALGWMRKHGLIPAGRGKYVDAK